MIWTILATGPSVSQEVADYIKGKSKVIAVSDAYKLAPWAECLVSYDRSWWRHHIDAHSFSGERFCRFECREAKKFNVSDMPLGCNSGLMGMFRAREYGATKIILLGFDMHGSHFFGRHPDQLRNTTEKRFKDHLNQFNRWRGPEVINCTPNSALKKFPTAEIQSIY